MMKYLAFSGWGLAALAAYWLSTTRTDLATCQTFLEALTR